MRASAADLRARIGDREAELADAGRVDVLAPLAAAADLEAKWQALDLDTRRAVVDTLVTVTVHPPGQGARRFDPDTVRIAWHGAP